MGLFNRSRYIKLVWMAAWKNWSKMKAVPELVLTAVERTASAFAHAVRMELSRGARGVAVLPDDSFAKDVFVRLPGVKPTPPEQAEILCLTHEHRSALEEALQSQIDRAGGAVIIGRLPGHGLDRSLFLISIPKAGTHLLYRFTETLGFRPGVLCPEIPSPGNWYCIEYSNSHTVPRDFFVDSVRRAPLGNRAHPFLSSAALFIVRHPWDVLVSEANYYPVAGNTAASGFFQGLDLAGCVERLLGDTLVLGRFRDRFLAFQPWLAFENVIPLAFEDLVGEQGGGSAERQQRLIWSIQLKLGVPGEPRKFAAGLFDRSSPTFQEGQIGSHRHSLPGPLLERLQSTESDVPRAFGYLPAGNPYTEHAENWRKQPLRCEPARFFETPILLESDYLGYNFVQYSGRMYAVPLAAGPIDIASTAKQTLAGFPQATSVLNLRAAVHALLSGEPNHSSAQRAARTVLLEADLNRRPESLNESLAGLTRRLAALEATVEERTQRLSVLQATIERETQRLSAIESDIAYRTRDPAPLERALDDKRPRGVKLKAVPK
jgi:hypothetical protein